MLIDSIEQNSEQLLINNKYIVSKLLFDKIKKGLAGDNALILTACLENHYRNLLINESDIEKRQALYKEGYSELSLINTYRNQLNHGANYQYPRFLAPFLQDKSMLELGCGTGELSTYFKTITNYYIGIDASSEDIRIAKERNPSCIFYENSLPLGLREYSKIDFIYSNDLLEHLQKDDLELTLKYSFDILKDDGCFFCVTSNSNFGPFDISRNFLKIGEKAECFHFSETTYSEIYIRLKKAGFSKIYSPILPF